MDSTESAKSEVFLDDDFEMDELLSEFAEAENKNVVQLNESEDELDSLVNEFAAAASDSENETKPVILSDDDEIDNLLEEFNEEECSENDLVSLNTEIKPQSNSTFICDTKNGLYFDSAVEIVPDENSISNNDSLDTLTSSKTEAVAVSSSEAQFSTFENSCPRNELSTTGNNINSESLSTSNVSHASKNPVLLSLLTSDFNKPVDCFTNQIIDQNEPNSEFGRKDENFASVNGNLDHTTSLKEVCNLNEKQQEINFDEISSEKPLSRLDSSLESINIEQNSSSMHSSLGVPQIKILNTVSLQKTDNCVDAEALSSEDISCNDLQDKNVSCPKISTVMSVTDKEEIVTHSINTNEMNPVRTHHKVLSTLPINEKTNSDTCNQLNCRKEVSVLDSEALLDDDAVATETEKENCPSLENNLPTDSKDTSHLKNDISLNNIACNATENLLEIKNVSLEKKESSASKKNYVPVNENIEIKEKDVEETPKCNGYASLVTQFNKRKLETLDCDIDRKKKKEYDYVDCKVTASENNFNLMKILKEIIPLDPSTKKLVSKKSLDKMALGIVELVIEGNYQEQISEAKTLIKNLEEKLQKQNKDLESYHLMLKEWMQSSQQINMIHDTYQKKTRTVGINVRTKDYRNKLPHEKTVLQKTENNSKSVNQLPILEKTSPKPVSKLHNAAERTVPEKIPLPNIIRRGNRLIPFLNPTKHRPPDRQAAVSPMPTIASILKDTPLDASSAAEPKKNEIADKGFEIHDITKLPENANIILPLNQFLQLLPPESRGSVVLPPSSSITTSAPCNVKKPMVYLLPPESTNCANAVPLAPIQAASSLNVLGNELKVCTKPTIIQQQPNTGPSNHPSLPQGAMVTVNCHALPSRDSTINASNPLQHSDMPPVSAHHSAVSVHYSSNSNYFNGPSNHSPFFTPFPHGPHPSPMHFSPSPMYQHPVAPPFPSASMYPPPSHIPYPPLSQFHHYTSTNHPLPFMPYHNASGSQPLPMAPINQSSFYQTYPVVPESHSSSQPQSLISDSGIPSSQPHATFLNPPPVDTASPNQPSPHPPTDFVKKSSQPFATSCAKISPPPQTLTSVNQLPASANESSKHYITNAENNSPSSQFHPTAPTIRLLTTNGPPVQSSSSRPSSKETAMKTPALKSRIPSLPQETVFKGNGKPLPPKPEVKVTKKDDGQSVMVSWNLTLTEKHSKIATYQIFSCYVKNCVENLAPWKKVGDITAMNLPMACTLRQFEQNKCYHFIVRAVDIHNRFGPFSKPASIYF